MKNNLAEFSLENLEVVTIMLKQTLETEDLTDKQLKIFRLLNKEVWKTYSDIKEKLQGYPNKDLSEIMRSLTESQPHLFLTNLEKKKGISGEDAIVYMVDILKKHTMEYGVGSSLKMAITCGDSYELYEYTKYVAMALIYMELTNRLIMTFNGENDPDLNNEGDDDIQKNCFPIIDMLVNWGADIKNFLDIWINNSDYPILNEYCFKKVLGTNKKRD